MRPARLDYCRTAPEGVRPMQAFERYLRTTDLEPALVELVRLRASLMNARGGVGDALYEEARAHFSEKALVDLTVAVIAINAWNRLAITFRTAIAHHGPAAAVGAETHHKGQR